MLTAISHHGVRIDATIIDKRLLDEAHRSDFPIVYSSLVANHLWHLNPVLHRQPVKLRVVLASLNEEPRQRAFVLGLTIAQGPYESGILWPLIERGEQDINKVPTSIWGMPSAAQHRIIEVADVCAGQSNANGHVSVLRPSTT